MKAIMFDSLKKLFGSSAPPITNRTIAESDWLDTADRIKNMSAKLHVTLWPAFPHFRAFAADTKRVDGIRLNSAMMAASEIDDVFMAQCQKARVPLWFDVKAMQLRIREVIPFNDHLEFKLNRPVFNVKTPCACYFKAGEDNGKLIEIRDGTHFIFEGGPKFNVKAGESIHLKDPNMVVGGEVFLDYEKEKIDKILNLGFTRWYLSYVYEQRHVDEFRELIGDDAELILKIENKAGLDFVANDFKKTDNTRLMTARGDMFVELDWPHEIMRACRVVIDKDPDAFVGSRMLLSLVNSDQPSCSDLTELAWLYDVGYRNFLLCDELCLKGDKLNLAVAVFQAFNKSYCI